MIREFKKYYRKIKRIIKQIIGIELKVKHDLRTEVEVLGSDDASWGFISSGINSNSCVYSFGLGTDVSFEEELLSKYSVNLHGFDPTPKALKYVQGKAVAKRMKIHPYGVAASDGVRRFYPPKISSNVSYTAVENSNGNISEVIQFQVRCLRSIMIELGHPKVDILKMDIEGIEYEVVEDILFNKLDIDQILLEVHHRFNGINLRQSENLISQLRENGYRLFWISECFEEFGFVSEKFLKRNYLE